MENIAKYWYNELLSMNICVMKIRSNIRVCTSVRWIVLGGISLSLIEDAIVLAFKPMLFNHLCVLFSTIYLKIHKQFYTTYNICIIFCVVLFYSTSLWFKLVLDEFWLPFLWGSCEGIIGILPNSSLFFQSFVLPFHSMHTFR